MVLQDGVAGVCGRRVLQECVAGVSCRSLLQGVVAGGCCRSDQKVDLVLPISSTV